MRIALATAGNTGDIRPSLALTLKARAWKLA